jgi:hypothetical protein
MIPFTICVEEADGDKVATGRELHKAYEWALVPHKGDIVSVGGNSYKVFEVIHYFDRNPANIEVILRWPESDFMRLSEDTSWKRAFWRE